MTQSAVVRAIVSVTLLVFSSSLDPRNTANADTEPVLVTYQESNWTDTAGGTESTPSITWQAADVIVVVGATEDSTHTLATPTAPGLTFSLVNSAGGAGNVNTYLWSAVAGGNGSGAVSSVKSSASAAGIAAFVYRGSTGIGNNATITGSTAKTISLTRSSDSSAVVLVMADWNAETDVAVTSEPTGGTIGVGDHVSGRATFWALNWAGQGAPGTASYGITNHTGTVDMSGVAVEIKGVGGPPDTTAPTISLSAPADGATVSASVTISANASDNVGVAGVQFFMDGNTLSAEDTTAPYSITWNSTSVVNGSHTLSARARDAAGNMTTSAGVTVTVNNAASDPTPPTVSILAPAQSETVSSTVSVTASAADNIGVAGVQFLLDGSNLGTEDTTSPYSVSWNTTSTTNGAHTLTARARDAAGNQTVSAPVGVTVNNVAPPGNNWSINGSQTFQTMNGFGVNINSLSWKNGESQPAIDLLADGMGATVWRVVFDEMNWETTNDDGNPNNFNWTYYNTLYSNAKFQHLWGTLGYLNQKGFTTNVALSFMGIGPSWMGANGTVTTAMEDEMVETIASLVYYARNTANVDFDILNPFNEPLWDGIEGPMIDGVQFTRLLNKLSVKLDALGLSDIRFMGPETAGGFSPSFVDALMNDPVVMNKIDHLSFHQYGGDSGGADSYIKGSDYPNKTFWVTEVAEPDAIWTHIGQGPTSVLIWEGFDSVYNHAIRAGRGTTAPNDTQGLLNPPVAYSASNGTYSPRSTTFYRDAAIFKFVGPGSTRISSTESISSISSYTYYNASTGRFTITGKNTSSSVAFNVTLNNLPPVSTVEFYRADTNALTKVSDISLTNNTFSFTAPANTYFTLTGLSGSDVTAPSVAITAPANGATVSGTAVVVSATSSDNIGVAGVQFKLDGANLGAEDTTAPYSVTWNASAASIGTHQLTADARDAAGNVATSSVVTVTVPDTVFPTAAITAPASGSTVTGTILVSANASDNVGVAGVQFLLDGGNLGAEDTVAPYSVSWDTTQVANGSHTLSARARDAAGNATTSSGVTVTVAPPPTGTFTAAPLSIRVGDTTTLTWAVANATSVTIDQEIGNVAASASLVVSPTATTTYHLTATGTGGTLNANVTVEVLPAQSDILWRHSSGQNYLWLMNGIERIGEGHLAPVDPGWQLVGAGDYNGDGHADILWRHDSGSNYMWLMNDTQRIGEGHLAPVDPAWQLVGAGDYNGDGRADILWRHTSGANYLWLMNGTARIGEGHLAPVDPAWQVAGAGDHNGDGLADILWRHTSGANYLWLMNGTERIGEEHLAPVDPTWQVVGAGDHNGDGHADILWRHTSGTNYLWLMNGTQRIGEGHLAPVDPAWQLVGTGDYNGDGHADILWRHSSGQNYMWLMNGTQRIGEGHLSPVDPTWQVVCPR